MVSKWTRQGSTHFILNPVILSSPSYDLPPIDPSFPSNGLQISTLSLQKYSSISLLPAVHQHSLLPLVSPLLKKTKAKNVLKNSNPHISKNTLKSAPTLLTWPHLFQPIHVYFRNKIPPPPIQHDRFHPYELQITYVAKRNRRNPDFDILGGKDI